MTCKFSQDTELGELEATPRIVTPTSALPVPKSQVHLGPEERQIHGRCMEKAQGRLVLTQLPAHPV